MKPTNKLLLLLCSILLHGCFLLPNNKNISISGNYLTTDENGNTIPFSQKVVCGIETTYYGGQLSLFDPTYEYTTVLFSEDDGTFCYEIEDVGQSTARLTSYHDADTMMFWQDTIINCSKKLTNVQILLKKEHTFKPIILPQIITRNDSITFTINHDALTLIEVCVGLNAANDYKYIIYDDNGEPEWKVLWRFDIDNLRSYTFFLDDNENVLPLAQGSMRYSYIYIRYTTLNHGVYWRNTVYLHNE